MQPVVQVAIDATSMDEGIRLADAAIRAGVDWLEAGTPFIHAEGMHGIRTLRASRRDSSKKRIEKLRQCCPGYLWCNRMDQCIFDRFLSVVRLLTMNRR